ncbi:gas vesicle protein [Paraburkholderia sp. A1RI_3L]|uniref:gas vesicle protein n=1 Tax=Paraburkholderia TaxID=1822464 RepID=UPI003B8058FD
MSVQRSTPQHSISSTTVADLLERILDKGIVIAGDIRINLVDVELLTIKIRLLICSVDKAREIGMDWWRTDPLFVAREPAAPATTANPEVIHDAREEGDVPRTSSARLRSTAKKRSSPV